MSEALFLAAVEERGFAWPEEWASSPEELQRWKDYYARHGPWSRDKNEAFTNASFSEREAMLRTLPPLSGSWAEERRKVVARLAFRAKGP